MHTKETSPLNSYIIPVLKYTKVSGHSDFRPIDYILHLWSRRCFEHSIFLFEIHQDHPDGELSFALRANGSAEEAFYIILHHTLQHLESPKTFALILSTVFSPSISLWISPMGRAGHEHWPFHTVRIKMISLWPRPLTASSSAHIKPWTSL